MCYDHIVSHLSKSRLGELMEKAEVSREELAELVESTPKVLEAIEQGKYDPPLSISYKLAAALKVPVENLFEDWTEQHGRIAD